MLMVLYERPRRYPKFLVVRNLDLECGVAQNQ